MGNYRDRLINHDDGARIARALEINNAILDAYVGSGMAEPTNLTTQQLQNLLSSGKAQNVLRPGNQIVTPWTDKSTGNEYQWVWDVANFQDVKLENGKVVPGLVLHSHYTTPWDLPFDACEYFYIAEEKELPAGTYYVTFGDNYSDGAKSGESYQFALRKPVPKGGAIFANLSIASSTPEGRSITTYDKPQGTEIESTTFTKGSEGTSLGTWLGSGNEELNSYQRASLGYNNWKESSFRQFLNSDKEEWWTAQNKYDRKPTAADERWGFMSGFSKEFLDVIQPVEVTTIGNNVTDGGETFKTFDKFFLPSLTNEHIKAQVGVEGETWDLWKMIGGAKPAEWYKGEATAFLKQFRINNKTSAPYVWLRSAYVDHAYCVWSVYPSGRVYGGDAAYDSRAGAPACVIAGIDYNPSEPRTDGEE